MLQPPEPYSPFLGSNVRVSVRGYGVGFHRGRQVFATAGLLLGKLSAHTRLPPCATLGCQVFELGG